MEDCKKRPAGDSAKSGSPKKRRVSKKDGGEKNKKQGDKPKRPASAYFIFLEKFRGDLAVKKRNGNTVPTKIGDIAKAAGVQWREMSDEEKKPFMEDHKIRKMQYDKQKQQHKPPRDENKPKKPRTAFFFFLEEFREKMKKKGASGKEIPVLAGEEWRSMNEEDKKSYLDSAAKVKEEYDKQMEVYLKQKPKENPAEQVSKKSKAQVREESESDDEEDDDDEEEENDDEDDEEEEDEDSD